MKRYVILGINTDGSVRRLANRRGCSPDEAIEQALSIVDTFDTPAHARIIAIEIGDAKDEIGSPLNIHVSYVKKVPHPSWELVPL